MQFNIQAVALAIFAAQVAAVAVPAEAADQTMFEAQTMAAPANPQEVQNSQTSEGNYKLLFPAAPPLKNCMFTFSPRIQPSC